MHTRYMPTLARTQDMTLPEAVGRVNITLEEFQHAVSLVRLVLRGCGLAWAWVCMGGQAVPSLCWTSTRAVFPGVVWIVKGCQSAWVRFVVVSVPRVCWQGGSCTARRVATTTAAAARAPPCSQPTAVHTCACTWYAWLQP